MQVLHWLKVNVFKVIVLMGTFALAMAAGNDLVNFIGVPLSGLSAYTDYIHNGNGDPRGFMMSPPDSSAMMPAPAAFHCTEYYEAGRFVERQMPEGNALYAQTRCRNCHRKKCLVLSCQQLLYGNAIQFTVYQRSMLLTRRQQFPLPASPTLSDDT